MPDVVDPATRSRMMSGIRGKNTKPELVVRSLLHGMGFRFRLHVRRMPGNPDIVLPRYRSVVQVHGCFWHLHDCSLFKWPTTRAEWWREKLERNQENDQRAQTALADAGWRIAVVWECAIKGPHRQNQDDIGLRLSAWLSDNTSREITIREKEHGTGSSG